MIKNEIQVKTITYQLKASVKASFTPSSLLKISVMIHSDEISIKSQRNV